MSRPTLARTLTMVLAILLVGVVLTRVGGVILGAYGIDIHVRR